MLIEKLIDRIVESEHYEEKLFYSVYVLSSAVFRQQVTAPGIAEALYLVVALGRSFREIESWFDFIIDDDYPKDYQRVYRDYSQREGTVLAPDSIAYEFSEGGFRAVSTSREWTEKMLARHKDGGLLYDYEGNPHAD